MGYQNHSLLEKVHIKYCKYLLNVKTGTPTCMVYGELGRLPIDINIKCKLLCYWHKLANAKTNELANRMYKVLYKLYIDNVFKSEWLNYIHKTLNECGMTDIWLNQGQTVTNSQLKSRIKLVLTDQFKQKWLADLENSQKCTLYKTYKKDLVLEKYLLFLNDYSRKMITKLRTCNHKLSIEKGRYNNFEGYKRYCAMRMY